MINPSAYIPLDRRYTLINDKPLPDRANGTVLFADISGFTPLTEALVRQHGPRRGVDELVRNLNRIFDLIIAQVHAYGGSVIGFAGDAITCWFDEAILLDNQPSTTDKEPQQPTSNQPTSNQPTSQQFTSLERASTAAFAIQEIMQNAAKIQIGAEKAITLELKAVLASGSARRFLVGNPEIQVIDVLAGSLLDTVAAGEQMAHQGETLVEQQSLESAPQIGYVTNESRTDEANRTFAVVSKATSQAPNLTLPELDEMAFDPTDVQSWVLPSVYRRIQSQDRFLAELRPAAALFLKFSGINYEDDPEAGNKLDTYIRWVQSIVNRYQGSLIQLTTGDKGSYFYVAIGAPIAHDDNLERAAAIALELRQMPSNLGYIATVQIGISEGRMRVGAYGSPTRQTYAVLGDATNLAARLMSRATYGQILVNQIVADEIGNAFDLQDLGYATFKGKAEPQAIYALLSQRTQQAEALTTQYASPLVGRDAELFTVEEVLNQTSTNQSQLLRISGEAGIGKSHLAAVILQQAQAKSYQIIVGGCQSTTQESAYYPIRPIVRQLLGLPDSKTNTAKQSYENPITEEITQEEQTQISHLEATLQVTNPDWLLRLPLLGDLLGLPIPDTPTTAAFDPQLRREALITLIIDMVQSRARQQPLLLLIEDIHWMDEASQELLLGLARAQAELPILLMLMHRPTMRTNRNASDLPAPEGTPEGIPKGTAEKTFLIRLAELPNQTYIELAELTTDGTTALVANLLASQNISPLALDLIQGLAQGNPFYVEELVDALLNSEQLIPISGTWVLAQRVINALRAANLLTRRNGETRLRAGASLAEVDLGIPDSIHGIVLARLDRLPEPVKLTLKVASVIGHVFEFEMLTHAHPTTQDPDIIIEQIELIEERDFAKLDTPDPQPRYIFRHNITQEVVYRTLLDEQRHDLHLAVGQAVEAIQPESVERLAYHFYNGNLEKAEVRAKAMTYLGEAGDRAKRDYANETALAFYDRALGLEERWAWMKGKIELLHLLGQRQEEMETLDYAEYAKIGPPVEIALRRSIYHEALSDYDEAQAMVETVLQLSKEGNDPEHEIHGLIQAGQIDGKRGNFQEKEHHLQQALEITRDHGIPTVEEAEIRYGLGIAYRESSEYDKAQEQFDLALDLAQSVGNRYRQAMILSAKGFAGQLQRQFDTALTCNDQAVEILQAIGDRDGESSALINGAQGILDSKGNISQAKAALERALHIQESVGNLWRQALIWNTLGILYNDIGQHQEAIGSLNNGIKIVTDIGAEIGKAHLECNLSEAYREIGDCDVSVRLLTRSMGIARKAQDRTFQAHIFTELSLTNITQGEYVSVIENASQALVIQESMEMEILTASSLAILGLAYNKNGNAVESMEKTERAYAILEKYNGVGPQYPQRDYYYCYCSFSASDNEEKARTSLETAWQLLETQVAKTSDPSMRESFINNVSFNRAIKQAVGEMDVGANGSG